MLHGKNKVCATAAQVEGRVRPGPEIPTSPEALSWLAFRRATLSRMVDDGYGHVETALEIAQIRKELGDLRRIIFVSIVKSYKGIEEKKARPEDIDGPTKTKAV
jgi:hypothetical protein